MGWTVASLDQLVSMLASRFVTLRSAGLGGALVGSIGATASNVSNGAVTSGGASGRWLTASKAAARASSTCGQQTLHLYGGCGCESPRDKSRGVHTDKVNDSYRYGRPRSSRSLSSSAGNKANASSASSGASEFPSDEASSSEGAVDGERKSFMKRYDWLLKLMGYYGQESTSIRIGQALFRGCEEQSRLLCEDKAFGLEFDWYDKKNFLARQQVLMLHVWMMHKRLLRAESADRGKEVQENLFDSLWDNTTRRVRATGVYELTVNKHLSSVQKICFTAALSYDQGMEIKDDEDLELGSAIWRNVFQSDPHTPDECVYKMSDYVRNQVEAFSQLKDKDLFDAKVNWMDLNVEGAGGNMSEWRQAMAVDGKAYWWNVRTRESRWTDPAALSNSENKK